MSCEGPYCNGCVQQLAGIKRLLPEGSGRNGVLLLGDSPWNDEIALDGPFKGRSGTFLDGLLAKRHLQRDDFTIHNVMSCKPPHLGWTDHPERFTDAALAADRCRDYLLDLMISKKPRAIVTLGNVATLRTTGLLGDIFQGYVIPSNLGHPVIPAPHPSHIIQGAHKLTIYVVLAIARALEIADGSYMPTVYRLLEDPPLDLLQRYLSPLPQRGPWRPDIDVMRSGDGFLMCDIETPESGSQDEEEAEDDASYNIIRMGFSNGIGTGCSFPFEGAYIARAKEAVRSARNLLFWNKNYDLPRLLQAGFTLHPQVSIVDAMWAWHFLQSDLPKALGRAAPFFYSGPPWKHLSSQRPAYYNAMDNAVQTSCYIGCRDALRAEGRWDRFMRQCRAEPILVKMGNKGVCVDLPARDSFMATLRVDAAAEYDKIQLGVPAGLLKVKQWVRQPKLMDGVTTREYPATHKDGTPALAENGSQLMKVGWQKTVGFNPNSPDQLGDLIRSYGLKMPRKRGEDRDTTEAKYLLRFAKKQPVFKNIVNYKQKGKMVSTYQWPLDVYMRAHSIYGYHPSTWRLSSRKVNLQNIPKRSQLAAQFRKMLIAAPGKVLVEADWSAIEAVLYGHLAGSESYIKLAKAGIHGWLASHVLKQPIDWQLPFDELQKQCKAMKKAEPRIYDVCKRIIHGSNFLFTPYGINDEYEEEFNGIGEVTKLQKLYFTLPPGHDIRQCHQSLLARAHKEKQLRNHFDLIHYFYEVYSYNKKAKRYDLGDDAKRAAAFVPQSDAAFMQRELFLWIDENYQDCIDTLELPTHDSIVAECSPSEVKEVAKVLHEGMTRGWAELGGLSIGVEIKVGANLLEQEEIHVH